MNKKYEIGSEQLFIETEIPIYSLSNMEICHDVNAHATAKLSVTVREEDQQEVLYRDWSDTEIMVLKVGESSELLFAGIIEKLVCHKEGGLLNVLICGISETAKLDREKRKQSFQKAEMPYRQVAQEVIQNAQKTELVWNIRDDKSIGTPLIQYEETDWEFLMRMASHFHEVLIPVMQNCKPKLHFGMCTGREQEGDGLEILGNGFDGSYYQNGCYESGMPRTESLYIKVKSKENWQMGDFLLYEGRRYQVYSRRILFEQGELFFICQLGMRGTFYTKRTDNLALAGVRLEGTIRKTEEESVYMQLDIDGEERADFPWIWAPETNNLSYCMPEVGTKAVLYLPTREEKDGRTILAAVHNADNARFTDVQKREFATLYRKKIGLYSDRLFAEGADGTVSVSMEDSSGIQIKSQTGISLLADGEIFLTGKKIDAFTPVELVCRTPQSNLELCRDINLYAPGGVKTIGTGTAVKRAEASETGKAAKKQETEYWQAAFSAVAAVPGADLGKIEGAEQVIALFVGGAIPKVAGGAPTIALAEVMGGQKESECSFPNVFQSMNNYTVKGGYELPMEEKGK